MRSGGVPMLISFSLENVYSFREESVLSMRASAIRAHKYSLIEARGKYYLPVAAIYGANASGKSNLLRALQYMMETISNPDAASSTKQLIFFMFTKNITDMHPKLKLEFYLDGNLYEYRLTAELNYFIEEELLCTPPAKNQPKALFSRKWDDAGGRWLLRESSNPFDKSQSAVLDEIQYVSSMANGQYELLLPALGKRGNFPIFSSIFLWAKRATAYQHPSAASIGVPSYHKTSEIVQILSGESKDIKEKEEFLRFIQDINPLIRDASIGKVPTPGTDNFSLSWNYKTRPTILKEDTPVNELVSLYESRGVYLAADLFPSLYHTLHDGGLLIVDELESSLHPLLMARVINMFTDPETNPGRGQLVFTTHNALLMDKKYFRQDEIVFVEKDEQGCSSLYRLSDIDGVRSDLDFCKSYICGSFGAIPEWGDPNA